MFRYTVCECNKFYITCSIYFVYIKVLERHLFAPQCKKSYREKISFGTSGQNRLAAVAWRGFKSNFELSDDASNVSCGRVTIRELRPSNGRMVQDLFQGREKPRRFVKVARTFSNDTGRVPASASSEV